MDLSETRAGARRELVRLTALAAARCAVPVLRDVGPWRARLPFALDGALDGIPGLRPDLRFAAAPTDADLALLGRAAWAAGYTLAYRDDAHVRVSGCVRPLLRDAGAVIRTFVESVLVPFHGVCRFARVEILWRGTSEPWLPIRPLRTGGDGAGRGTYDLDRGNAGTPWPMVCWLVHRDGDADVTTPLGDRLELGPCVLARTATGFSLRGDALVNGQRAHAVQTLVDHDVLEIDGVEYVYLSTT